MFTLYFIYIDSNAFTTYIFWHGIHAIAVDLDTYKLELDGAY